MASPFDKSADPQVASLVRVALMDEERMKYRVALKQTEEGFSVSCPGLPGCWSQGSSEQEALANIRDAIAGYLMVREELLLGADVREVEVSG